jgi:hypothetical protein
MSTDAKDLSHASSYRSKHAHFAILYDKQLKVASDTDRGVDWSISTCRPTSIAIEKN